MDVELPGEDEQDPFRRRMTVLIVTVTFFGTLAAFLQTRASNQEAVAGRQAQINAVQGIGVQLATAAETTSAYDIFIQASGYDRRATVARGQARTAGAAPEARALENEAKQWEQVKAAIAPLSPLLSDKRYIDKDVYTNPYYDDRFYEAAVVANRQAAQNEVLGVWGSKSNSYVAVITILAVSLFLLGLSLIVAQSTRRFISIAAIGMFAIGVVWAVILAVTGVPRTPESAIKHVAEGDRLVSPGHLDFDRAIAEYTKAIEIRPDYALAYDRRGNAYVLKGSREVQQGATGFVSITDPKNLQLAIRDRDKALTLGLRDTGSYSNQGFDYFLVRDYGKADKLTNKALELNPSRAHIWANLGLIRAAKGEPGEAESAYKRALALIRKRPSFERTNFYNAARTDLEILAFQESSRRELVKQFKELVTLAESEVQVGHSIKPGSKASAKVTRWDIDGANLTANFSYKGMTKGAVTAFMWYFRPDAKEVWAHDPKLFSFVYDKSELTGSGTSVALNNSRECPVPGQYRLDIYENGNLIGSGQTTVKSGVLGKPSLYENPLLSFTLCRPRNWKVDDSDTDAVTFQAPDGNLNFRVGSLPLGQGGGTDPAAIETATIRALALGGTPRGGAEEFTAFDFGGVSGRLGYYTVEVNGRPFTRAVAASVASDGVLRTMIATSTDDKIETLNELLDTLKFTNAPVKEGEGT